MQLEHTDPVAVKAPAATPLKRSWPSFTGAGPLAGLALMCIAGAFLNENFATLDNAMNVLTRTAFIGIIAVGMCFVIISGGIDLSVGSMAARSHSAARWSMSTARCTTAAGWVCPYRCGCSRRSLCWVVSF